VTTGVNTSFPMRFGAFDGLQAFADCARREPPATWDRKRITETAEELTPRQAQIARPARDGHTNLAVHRLAPGRMAPAQGAVVKTGVA
jgi:hypothetical protein